MLYNIIRFYADGRPSKLIKEGVSISEAQAHCRRADTSGEGWFDGYQRAN